MAQEVGQEMANQLGFANFIQNVDSVGKAVLVFLLILSIASWYLIFTKSFANWLEAKRAKAFLEKFRDVTSLEQLNSILRQGKPDNAFAKFSDRRPERTTQCRQFWQSKVSGRGWYFRIYDSCHSQWH